MELQETSSNQLKPSKHWYFQQGNKLGGRTEGSRNKLTQQFFDGLYADFKVHGVGAIAECREKDVSTYLKICASLIPRDIVLKKESVFNELTADELRNLSDIIQAGLIRIVDVTPERVEEPEA